MNDPESQAAIHTLIQTGYAATVAHALHDLAEAGRAAKQDAANKPNLDLVDVAAVEDEGHEQREAA